MHDLHLLPSNCQIQLLPQTANSKLSPVELFVYIPAHFRISPAHSFFHSFIHSLSKDCDYFVRCKQKQEQRQVTVVVHSSHTQPCSSNTNLRTLMQLLAFSSCYVCFSQPPLTVCMYNVNMYIHVHMCFGTYVCAGFCACVHSSFIFAVKSLLDWVEGSIMSNMSEAQLEVRPTKP